MNKFHGQSIVISQYGAKGFKSLNPENNVGAAQGKHMKVHREHSSMHIQRNVEADLATFKLIAISDKHPQGRRGLSLETQGFDHAFLHKIVHTAFVDQDHHQLMRNPATYAQRFWGGLSSKCVEAYLGLKWFKLRQV